MVQRWLLQPVSQAAKSGVQGPQSPIIWEEVAALLAKADRTDLLLPLLAACHQTQPKLNTPTASQQLIGYK